MAAVQRSVPMSRGRQLEAAVDSLSSWYFEYDEPKIGWYHERIHPLPEESSMSEPQDDLTSSFLESTAKQPSCNQEPEQKHEIPTPQASEDKKESHVEEIHADNHDSDEHEHPEPEDRRASWSPQALTAASSAVSSAPNELVVSGYTIRGSEKKVMYHIDVRGLESQLQTYTIRRSYTDFKHLHSALSDILEARREHYEAKKLAAASERGKNSSSSMTIPPPTEDPMEAWFMSFTLPPLPHAGFLSYWKRHDRTHLQNRCEMFQEILRVANSHPDLRECYAMQAFLSIAPCVIRERGSSYVSLCEYSVPQLNLEEEIGERKKLARERRRNSSANPTTSTE